MSKPGRGTPALTQPVPSGGKSVRNTYRLVYPVGSVNVGIRVLPPLREKAEVVPKGLEPLQSKSTRPELPGEIDPISEVNVGQAVGLAGIAGKVCVKRVVTAYAVPITDIISSAKGEIYFFPIFIPSVHLLARIEIDARSACDANLMVSVCTDWN